MANIFISHSSRNSDRAIEVRDWLAANGWDDVFLDLDPERGIVAGQRWKEALQQAAHRCEVVLALVSPEWLASSWCKSEIDAARLMGKKIIIALIGVDKSLVPLDLSDEQWIDLVNDPAAYTRLKEGLKRAGLDPSSFALEPGRRPYPGFAYLEEKDAALFFGRDAQIVRGLDKMRGLARTGVERMLVILGASGSGKSSFLRAGLWPRLKRDDRNWLPLPVIRPERAAISGKFGLAQALLQTMTQPQFADRIRQLGLPRSRADIQEFIEKNDDGLLRILAALRDIAQVPGLAGETVPPPTIVLAIDQGEELFNEDGHDEASRLIAILTRTLKADRRVLALVAMRSDAFPQLQSEPSLAELAKDTFTLDMMLEGSYRAVIEEPARLVRPNPLRIDPQLIDALLEDISGQDALPLLAFTLAHLYEHYAADNELSLSGYEKLGRLKGVIDTTVKEAFAEGVAEGALPKDPKAQLALARAAFIPHLAQVNAAGQFVRRVASRDEIPGEAKPLIDRFAERRLLIRDRRRIAGNDTEIIEVAHETLLRQPPFSEWLAEDREFLVWRERLSQARAAFEANQRGLLAGRELQFARDWAQRRATKDIAPLDRQFISDSVAEDNKRRADEAERERVRQATEREARQARKLRRAVIAAGLLAVTAGFGWWFAFEEKNNARLTQLKFLADLSSRETEQGDAGTGLLLALEALPDRNSEDADVKGRQYWPAAAISLERAHRALLERKVLRGHHGPVNAVAAIPGGNRIVTASEDGTARIWDVDTGEEKGVLKAAGGKPVTALAMMSGPTRIVTGSEDGSVRIWDADTLVETNAFESKGGAIAALAVTPEQLRVIGFSKDGKGHIWSVLTGADQPFVSQDIVNAVAVTSDGKRLIAGSNDKIARVWDIETQKLKFELRGHDGPITAVAVTREGNRIVTGSNDRTLRIWDADTGDYQREIRGHLDSVTDVTITPDGKRIISVSTDRTAYIWDAETGTSLGQVGGHQSSINAVTVTSDGNRIVTGSNDWTTRIWDMRPRTELAQFRGHGGPVTAVAATSDGSRVVTASSDKTARIWDAKAGVQQARLKGHTGAVTAVAITPAGTRVVTGSDDNTARIWDAKSGLMLHEIRHQGDVTAVAVTRDGTRVVTGSRDSVARVWDIERPAANAIEISGHNGAVTAVAVMADGRIVTGSSDRTTRVWKLADKSYQELKGHQSTVTAVTALDDVRVVTGSLDKTARVWDVRTGRELAQLKGHQAAVTAVVVTPDGAVIITGSRDGTTRIWDARTYEELARIKAHERFVTAVALVPALDGLRIVTGSSDGTARLWELLPVGQALIDYAKTSVVRCLSPAQRERYYLPPTQPRWCGSGEKYPYDSVSAMIEGRRLLIDGKVNDAKALFTEAARRNSDGAVNQTWAGAYIEYGRHQLAEQQDDEARVMFAEALKRDPSASGRIDAQWADAYVARGRALLRQRKDDEARTIFAEALKLDPSAASRIDAAWVVIYGLRGTRLMREAKIKEADIVFTEALRQYPSQGAHINTEWANAYIERGRDLLRAVKDEDAKAAFARALQRDPSAGARINTAWANTFVDRGKKPLGQGNDEAAKAAFEEALRFDASAEAPINAAWASAYIERGVKQLDQGNDDAAKDLFDEAIKRDSSAAMRIEEAWANGYIKRGVAFISADNDGDAKASFAKATQHDPSARKRAEEALVEAYIDRGTDLIRNGKEDEADAAFAKALDRNPSVKKRISDEQISASIERGARLIDAGEEQQATITFARALQRDPAASQRIKDAWAIAYNELAWKSFLELPQDKPLGSFPKAEVTLGFALKAVGLAPENAYALDTRGAIYRTMGRIDEALADFDKAIKIGIKAPSTYFERGRCHEQKNNIELAIADYQKAADLPAEDDYSRSAQTQAKERLAELRGRATSLNATLGSASQ